MRSMIVRSVSTGLLLAAVVLLLTPSAHAQLQRAWITGEQAGADVVFRVDMDPTLDGSAVVSIAVTDPTFRLDGIDIVPGLTQEFVVGAQVMGPSGGAIRHFRSDGTILTDFVSNTNLAPGGPVPSKPSSVLSTPTHAYYTENQFGFTGPPHRILRTPFGVPPGTMELVFDGAAPAAGALTRLEGLERAVGRLYFFAHDNAPPMLRALYSIGLTPGGLWDGAAPMKHLPGLAQGGPGDGSDELDLEDSSGRLFGSNIVNGEVICWHTVAMTPCGVGGGPFLISGAAIAGGGPKLMKMGTARIDGIRATGTGHLILTGMSPGTIFSVDIGGVLGNGADDGDIRILIEDASRSFDDLTPASPVPLPIFPTGNEAP